MGEMSLQRMGEHAIAGNCSVSSTLISGLPPGKTNYIIYASWGASGDNIITNRTAFAAFIGSTKCRIWGSGDAGAVIENCDGTTYLTLDAATGAITSNKNFDTTSGLKYKYVAW